MMNCLHKFINIKNHAIMGWIKSISLLSLRLFIAKVFFAAGLVKLDSWSSTLSLFEYEYNVPVIPFEIAAYMATAAEISLPILLIFGLFTPFAALGLFIMSAVIELFIYPGTTEHYYWLLLLGVLMTHGAGKLSLDHLGLKFLSRKCAYNEGASCDKT